MHGILACSKPIAIADYCTFSPNIEPKPFLFRTSCRGQNTAVKACGSLDKLKDIAWGHSGNRVRAKKKNREGLLSVEDQVRAKLETSRLKNTLN